MFFFSLSIFCFPFFLMSPSTCIFLFFILSSFIPASCSRVIFPSDLRFRPQEDSCFCLSVHLSVCFTVCVCLSHICIYIVSPCTSVFLVSLWVCLLSQFVSIVVSTCLSIMSLSLTLSMPPIVPLYVPVSLLMYVSVCLCVCLSLALPLCLPASSLYHSSFWPPLIHLCLISFNPLSLPVSLSHCLSGRSSAPLVVSIAQNNNICESVAGGEDLWGAFRPKGTTPFLHP